MKLKHIKTGELCTSSTFNTNSINEIIVYGEDWCDSCYMSDFLFWIESKGEWMTLHDAWEGKHILPDNYNTWFAEPTKQEDIERGYFL